jgi:oryzin
MALQVLAVEPVKKVSLATVQRNAEWGLASISHRTTGSNEYLYDAPAGNAMYAYLVDTGINTGHQDFQGRASNGYNAYPGVPFVDANGHGTHCAGTIAGRVYGVAKRAKLIAVKVFHTGSVRSSAPLCREHY